jgi:hypothetical protein
MITPRLRGFAATLGASVLLACSQKPIDPPPAPVQKPEVLADKLPPMPNGHPDLGALTIASRAPRRLSVDQLERSLDEIGNLPKGSVKLPPDLAITLGRPDYARVTEESLEPTPLYMKFMLDLGAIYCGNLADYEPTRPAADKFYTRNANVDDNLAWLLLRFTGIEGEGAKPYLTRLRAAYDRGAKGARPLGGYEAACLSLFTSPEFLLY